MAAKASAHRRYQLRQIRRLTLYKQQALLGVETSGQFGQHPVQRNAAIKLRPGILGRKRTSLPVAHDNGAAPPGLDRGRNLDPGPDQIAAIARHDRAGKLQPIVRRPGHQLAQRRYGNRPGYLAAAAPLQPGQRLIGAQQAPLAITGGMGQDGCAHIGGGERHAPSPLTQRADFCGGRVCRP